MRMSIVVCRLCSLVLFVFYNFFLQIMAPKKVRAVSARRARSGPMSRSKRMKEIKKGISLNRNNPLNVR